MATYAPHPFVIFGFVQFNSTTYPALTIQGNHRALVWHENQFCIVFVPFTELSEFEFHKWFGWTPLEEKIELFPDGRYEFRAFN